MEKRKAGRRFWKKLKTPFMHRRHFAKTIACVAGTLMVAPWLCAAAPESRPTDAAQEPAMVAPDTNRNLLDLRRAPSESRVLRAYSGTPDPAGVMEKYKLQLPAIKRGIYYRGFWWPYGGNRMRGTVFTTPQGEEGGAYLLLELADGGYLAVLPLCGEKAYSWLSPENGEFHLKMGTHGKASIEGDIPLVSWAVGASPYEACAAVWKQAADLKLGNGWLKLRETKKYPEMFQYLGWCSWEGYRKDITSDSMVAEFKGLEASPVPVRFFLVDDGHFDESTIGPHKEKFPQGYKPLTDLRTKDGIRWVGMWYALLGKAAAMPAGQPRAQRDVMMRAHNGRMVAKPDSASIETFMNYMLEFSKRDDIDFVKVDFCGALLPMYAGTQQKFPLGPFPGTTEHAIANPSEATATYSRIYQAVVADKFNGLINCNWHVPHFIFYSGDSVVGRCSEDYKLDDMTKAKEYFYHAFTAMPWLGQIYWGDHDMFHSSDPVAGKMMGVAKAMSGGPIYLSDHHTQLVPENIRPVCYEDGLLLRPLAPASPLPEDMFSKMDEKRLFRVMAPLENKTAAFVLYHFDFENNQAEVAGTITPRDYQAASGMIQPYAGDWAVPDEGLVVYDYFSKRAEKLGSEYRVSIKGFDHRLLQVSPIQSGWSVIGRSDKYLSAATVEILSVDSDVLKLRLKEAGPFAIWLKTGAPKADGINFIDKGNGLYEGALPVAGKSVTLTIERR